MNLRATIYLCLATLITVFVVPAVHAEEVGLVGHWAFEQNLKDSTPNELHGTLRAPTYVQGIHGAALLVNGREEQVEIPHKELLDLDTYTISMWIRSDASTPYATLLRKGNDERENYKLTLKYGNRLMGYMLGGDQRLLSLIPKEAQIENRQWQFVVMTFNGSVWNLWVDGKEVFTRTLPEGTVPAKNTEPLLIGNENNLHGRGFTGAIDEVKLYNYAMTAEQIQQEYRALLPDPSKANLVAHYDLEGSAKEVRRAGLDGVARNMTFHRGKQGNGAVFNGKDAFIEVPSSAALQMTRFSMETWLSVRAHKAENYVYSKGATGQEQLELRVGTRGELLGFLKFQNGERAWFRTPRDTVSLGTWHHVVQTFEDNVYRIYVDGVMRYERVLQGRNMIATSTAPLFIGRKQLRSDSYFDGMLDEVRIYNRALSAEEIRLLQQKYMNQTANTTRESAMVGHWTLDRTVKDTSPAQNHGKIGLVQFESGILGDAARFDDRRSGVRIPDANTLDQETFSIALWAKLRSYSNGRYFFFKGKDTTMNYALQTRMDGGITGTITFADGTTGTVRSQKDVMKRDTWHHIVMTYTPGQWELWVDGVRVGATDTQTGTPQINAEDFFIGNNGALSSEYLPGSIDDLRIWNYVLTPEEIKTLAEPLEKEELSDTL